jgi:hypothetical protein
MYPFKNEMDDEENKSIDTLKNSLKSRTSYSVPWTAGSFIKFKYSKKEFFPYASEFDFIFQFLLHFYFLQK